MADPSTQPDAYSPQFWWNVIQGGTTAVLAFFGYLITRRNAEIAERNVAVTELKSRLEQFDKRYAVFAAVQNLFVAINRNNTVSEEDMQSFHINAGDAAFLFYEEVTVFIADLSDDGRELQRLTHVYDEMPVGPAREAAVKARYEFLGTLRAKRSKAVALFLPYLDVRPTKRPVSMEQIGADFMADQEARVRARLVAEEKLKK